MTLSFPSPQFDDVVAAVCHGAASAAEMGALNELLRSDPRARDEYLMRIELHTRLASDPDLFAPAATAAANGPTAAINLDAWRQPHPPGSTATATARRAVQVLALAASLVLLATGVWGLWLRPKAAGNGDTSTAVAMLTRAVDADWGAAPVPVGSALEPGRLRLASGLAQVVFYSGARVVIEGPAELQIISQNEAVCPSGRLLAEVPPPALGFRLKTDHLDVVDLGTEFGIDANRGRTEVHVFKGKVEVRAGSAAQQPLGEGEAAVATGTKPLQRMAAKAADFKSLYEFQQRSVVSEALRYEQWQLANAKLNQDPALVVHLEFQDLNNGDWTLRNTAERNRPVPDATIVGCQRAEGRWREKQALEFQSVNDRVRLAVPGEYDALTLSAWVCVKGLDRQFNSLFMCDGFEPGTVHWLIRNDGALGLTVFGPKAGNMQITATPPVLTLKKLGMWVHFAAVLDGKAGQVVHYVDGVPVARQALKVGPPFRLGSTELGNWNARTGPNPAPNLIRNLSGSLDEFELFSRALNDAELHDLYIKGRPDQ